MSGFNNPERINEELEDVIRGRSTNSLTHEDFLTEPTIVRTTHPARCPQCGSRMSLPSGDRSACRTVTPVSCRPVTAITAAAISCNIINPFSHVKSAVIPCTF